MHDELSQLMAEHLKCMQAETFLGMSDEQARQHAERLKRIRKLSDEYLSSLDTPT